MSSSKMKESINNPLEAFDIENETLKNELVKIRSQLATLKQNIKNTECDKSKSFDQYVRQSDKLCNHYTDFPTNIILQAVFEYLNTGESGENVLYNELKPKNLGGKTSAEIFSVTLCIFWRKIFQTDFIM